MDLPRIAPIVDPEHAAVVARFRSVVAGLPKDLSAAATNILERVSTPNWYFEWNFPLWLGRVFAVKPSVLHEIVLGNVYGLGFVRLFDDALDESAAKSVSDPMQLAAVLHNLWMEQYTPFFQRNSPFWEHLSKFNGQWLKAAFQTGGPSTEELHADDGDVFRWLAERGAPMKICCTALCILADREQELARLNKFIDHLMAGAVLVDHADDWQVDVEAGRYNAFVLYLTQCNYPYLDSNSIHGEVLDEILLKDQAYPYFAKAVQEFQKAIDLIQPLGIRELEAHLSWLKDKTKSRGETLGREMKKYVRLAAKTIQGFL